MALAIDATHARTNRYAYDGNDQCAQALGDDAVSGADPHQAAAYEYDERGLLFRAITAPGSALAATNELDYNPNGKSGGSMSNSMLRRCLRWVRPPGECHRPDEQCRQLEL